MYMLLRSQTEEFWHQKRAVTRRVTEGHFQRAQI